MLGSGEQGTPAPWVWVGADAALIRGLFRALNGHCISEVPRGWTALERIACYLRCGAFLSVDAVCMQYEGLCAHSHRWSFQNGAGLLSLRNSHTICDIITEIMEHSLPAEGLKS